MSEAVVLGGGQLYTADRGPIRLYEDIIQALYENTHFMTPLLTNDLKFVMRYKTNFPQISENFIKYTVKAKIYKYKMKLGYTCTEILFSVEISNQIWVEVSCIQLIEVQYDCTRT
jgi:hypothetical protein